MKSRFNTIDITAVIRELLRFVSMRVMNVYDVDNKTYLIRLGKPDDKAVIVLESGIKIHSTEFEWPKNPAPSGFSMKMRKHLKGRRLESVRQLGVDRIIDMAFGSGEAAYHVILELYDRGNIVLTDFTYTILNILRPRTDTSQDVRFAVRETYPLDAAKQHELPTEERLRELILTAKPGDTLKKVLIPHLDYGPAVIEHCLIGAGFPENVKIGKGFNMTTDMGKLLIAIEEAEDLLNIIQTQPCRGYITQKCEKRAAAKEGERTELLTYDEFHPMLFRQLQNKQNLEFDTFNKAVDEFYSQTESQKIELKTLQQEKAALKKLDNVKKDHEKRVEGLQKEQEGDKMKGQLIEMNLGLVDKAIQVVRSAIANQIDWTEIKNLVKEAQMDDDPVAMAIKELKLDTNHIILLLQNPYVDSDFEEGEEDIVKPMRVDINLGLSAYSNSRKYFEMKKHAAVKEQKTMDASVKALKSAERKAKETLKDVATAASINKARKTYWFEKFLWFISSENFLVIGGRDQQQNELLVKRYMKSVDTYVHADLHGASTVIIKNSTGSPVPPKTLNEAGTMAICNSAAWDAKVVTSAWWVYPSQVTKTAPSGEYLSTGSFMIRGKKNYLPPSYLIYGFGFLFKLEEGSVPRHAGERRVRTAEEDEMSIADSTATEVESVADSEITLGTNTDEDDDDDSEDESEVKPGHNDEDTDEDKQEKIEIMEVSQQVSDEGLSDLTCQETCVDTDVIITEPVLIKDEENIRSMSSHNSEEKEKQSARDDVADTECDSADTEKTGDQSGDGEAPATGNIGTPVEFPDTEISLQHVKGDKYELLRTRSDSNQSTEPAMDIIYLGDSMPVVLGEKTQSAVRLSAKQKREMKKAKKQTQWITTDDKQDKDGCQESIAEEQKNADIEKKTKQTSPKQQQEQQTQQQEQQPKRRQKAKLKKMKEKYGDQDAEERQLRMEILASAGVKKEDKKKKGKKGEDKGRPASTQNQNRKQPYDGLRRKPELVDIIIQDVADLTTDAVGMKADSPQEQQIKEPQPPVDGEEERQEDETQTGSDDSQVLTSLTGCPVTEDELLYAMPVCAPYNALINYKYKVKLLPGSTKRGKAAKTALNTHLLDKNVTSREKDLLKILKDVDMARNIPGKAKVAAPNLHKGKKK